MISAIILAADVKCQTAGRGSAYGRCSIAEEVVNNFLESRVDEVVLVVGARDTKLEKALEKKPVKIVINPDYRQGLSHSIRMGLQAVDNRAGAVLVALGDQPLIRRKVIDAIVARYTEGGKGIVAPIYKGIRGHPGLFDMKYKEELLGLTGNMGGREIIRRHPEDLADVEVDTPAILFDIQADADYLMQMKKFSTLDKA